MIKIETGMKKIFLLYFFFLLFLTACQKNFLNRAPLDAYSNGALWKTANDAITAVNGCYSGHNNGWENEYNIYYMDCASDNAYNQFPWEGFQPMGNGTLTPTNTGNSRWNFGTVTTCNWFLANVGETPMDSTLKLRLMGEARFIRAYQYFVMAQLYGDVPLVTTQLSVSEANSIKRTAKADIVSFILTELGDIAPHLPISYSGSDVGRITRGAALALRARVELYNGEYSDCVADCQQVMQLGYSLFPSYSDLFRMANKNNSEVILDVEYAANTNLSNWVIGVMASNSYGGWSSIDPTQGLVDAYEMDNGKTIDDPSSGYDPAQPFKNRDPRLAATIVYPGQQYARIDGSPNYYDPLDASSSDYYQSGNCSRTGYEVKKWLPVLADYTPDIFNTSANPIVIRYAEVLLTYAEAKIESGQIDNSVYDALDAVRVRAGMPAVDRVVYSDQSTLRTLVRRERRVELAMEGLRWFDIQRWQIGPQVMTGPAYGSLLGSVDPANGNLTLTSSRIVAEQRTFKNYLWPIPQTEIDINKNLLPNNGY